MPSRGKSVPHRTHRWAGTTLGLMMGLGLLLGAVFGNAALGASVGVVIGALLELASWHSRSQG